MSIPVSPISFLCVKPAKFSGDSSPALGRQPLARSAKYSGRSVGALTLFPVHTGNNQVQEPQAMPLRAVGDAGNVQAFEFDATSWATLKQGYRALGLRIPCCGSPAIPKTSKLGNFFFAHERRGECTTAPESPEHLYCKGLIARGAQSAGWTVTTERPGATPEGEDWIADVFCEKGAAKIVIEVQMSPQTDEEAIRRQVRYKASGVRGAWFYGPRARKTTVAFDKDTPAFGLPLVEIGVVPPVQRFGVPLDEFVIALLSKRLIWTVPEYSRPHYVEFMHDTCWACQKPVKQIYGHLNGSSIPEGANPMEDEYGGWHERHFTVASLSQALESVLTLISSEQLRAQGLNAIGTRDVINGKPTHWKYSNFCIHCRAPQNNFHVGERLSKALYGARESEDECAEPKFGLTPIPRLVKGAGEWVFHALKKLGDPLLTTPTGESIARVSNDIVC